MKLLLLCTLFALSLLLLPTVEAGAAVEGFFPEGTFDPTVPSPDSFLGYPIGERRTHHEAVLRYFKALEEHSPHARLFRYGRTHEGRVLFYLAIGSPLHIEHLDDIGEMAAALADPRRLPPGEGERIVREMPALAWMAYAIHGDELSSTEAALLLAYRLVAGTDEAARFLRDRLVVFIDPLQNPDGRERFLAQLDSIQGRVPNPDTNGLHFRGFWMRGRGNHYLFDLNRDWFTLIHPESRGRIAAILSWHPQLVVDAHEMGPEETYLFSPPREPFNPHLTAAVRKWWPRFAKAQAAAFDREGWSYYTREWNEEWYPGYGSSWSIYTGAVGILYEQAATAGRLVKRADGTLLTYEEAIRHHLVSSLANLETLAEHREEILGDFLGEKRRAVEKPKKGAPALFLFPPAPDPDRTVHLVERLLRQQIEVFRAEGEFSLPEATDFWGETRKAPFPAGTFLVPLDQPLSPLVRAILDFHLQMDDAFLRDERRHLEREEASRLYEVTAWSMPVSYQTESYWSPTIPDVPRARVTLAELRRTDGHLFHPDAKYGFLIDGGRDRSIDAAARLLEAGYRLHAAREPFAIAGRAYPRGSFLLRRRANAASPSLTEDLERIARQTGIEIVGVDSALAESGSDLGGNDFRLLEMPRVGVFAGSPVSPPAFGEIWFLFDEELGIRLSPIDLLAPGDLDKYNVLILPSLYAEPERYRQLFGKEGIERLKGWVERGGTLIVIGDGAAFVAARESGLSRVCLRREVLEKFPPPRLGLPEGAARRLGLQEATGFLPAEGEAAQERLAETLGIPGPGSPLLGPGARAFLGVTTPSSPPSPPEGEEEPTDLDTWTRIDERLRRFSPQGTFLRADLDTEHWLAYGLPERMAVLIQGDYAYIARKPVRTVARLSDPAGLHVSGLLWPEAAGRLARTAYLTIEGMGRGSIILFAASPLFRASLPASARLFKNAVVLAPGLGASHPAPW